MLLEEFEQLKTLKEKKETNNWILDVFPEDNNTFYALRAKSGIIDFALFEDDLNELVNLENN
jgi:hypothetical protein